MDPLWANVIGNILVLFNDGEYKQSLVSTR